MKVRDVVNRTKKLGSSVAEFEAARQKNIKDGIWACACGSRKFHSQQQAENVKTFCVKCGNCDIIYWNGDKDSSKGHMKRLDTGKWVGGNR